MADKICESSGILEVMSSDPSGAKLEPTDEAWHEIDELVEQIAQLSALESPPGEFYAQVMNRIVPAVAATGGAVWTEGPDRVHLEYQVNAPRAEVIDDSDGRQRHAQLIQQVLATGRPKLVPPGAGSESGGQAANPTGFVLVLCPWRLEDSSAGVLELFQRPGASPSAQRGYLHLLTAVGDLVTDFHRNRQSRGFRQRIEQFDRFEQFVKQAYGSLDLKTVAYRIANEGRRLIGCDRLSVVLKRGSKCRLTAVSGVDKPNRRANVVRQLEKLCAVVTAVNEPLWHPDSTAGLPEQIEEPLSAYLDESHAREVAVIPLEPAADDDRNSPHPAVIGALVVEQFHGKIDDRMRPNVSAVARHAAPAIANALDLDNIPMGKLLRLLGKARWLVGARQLPKTVTALLAVAAAVFALATVPGDFTVEARGELQPLARREIFAPADGVVNEVRASHARQVSAGQILVKLRKPELDFEFKRVWGELQTSRKRLASVEAQRLQNPRESQLQRREHSQLAAEVEELNEAIDSLQKQYDILQEQQAELQVKSPIDGQVLTWDIEQLLEARPVGRGQILLTVADLDGPWVLELKVPDDRIAHLLDARDRIGNDLQVAYVLATDPGVELNGRVERFAMRTEIDQAGEAFVPLTVSVSRDQIPALVPGAGVVAKIHCGRRPIGYVWLHDLIEALERWILF